MTPDSEVNTSLVRVRSEVRLIKVSFAPPGIPNIASSTKVLTPGLLERTLGCQKSTILVQLCAMSSVWPAETALER